MIEVVFKNFRYKKWALIVALFLSNSIIAKESIVCFNSNELAKSTVMPPAIPGVITGTTAQCPSVALQTYSIAAVPGALSYTWTIPTGWTITAGAGTTSITVTTGNTGQNGNISVRAVDGSGSSGARSLAVTVGQATPATPGVISGTTTQCPSLISQTYSVVAVANATSYLWTVPSGWTITAGAATRTITVSTGVTGDDGTITVSAVNSCGTSAAQTLAVSVSPAKPVAPNATTGTNAACSGFTANWDAAIDATSYRLDVSTINTFVSFVTGYNNLSIGNVTTADVSGLLAGRTYYYRVRAVNSCGTSVSSNVVSFATLSSTPTTPISIAGTTAQCPSLSNQIYSTALVANATFYTWSVPTGWTITDGSGTNTITVSVGITGQNGNITVAAANSCGTSANRTLAVTVKVGVPNIPTATAGTNAACTGFRANWSAAAGATTYYLDVATDSGFTSFVSGYNNRNVGNVFNATVTGLTAGTTYYYRVLAASSCDVSPYSATITFATLPVPIDPIATAATLPACTTSRLNWNVATGATSYRLDIATDAAFTAFVPTYNNANVGNVLFRNVTGLTAGTTYYYRVLAVNTCGNSGYSNTVSFATNPRPVAPTATAGTAITCSSITANWTAVAGATSYRLDVSLLSDFSTFVAGNNNRNVGNVTTFNVTTLAPATTYYYRVLAVNACGSSVYSNTISGTTNPAPPAPTANPATTATCTGFRANWALVAGATNYRLDVSTASDFSSFVTGYNNTSVGNVAFRNVTGLTPGTTYYYRVLATYPCGNSGYSSTITYATLPLPIAPTATAGTTATCTGFKANWAALPGATSYRLDVATDAAFALFVSGYNNSNVGNVLSFNVAGLNPGTTYYYRVAAANACGVGAYSSTITFATSPLPIAPIANTVSGTTCTGVSTSWSAIAGATSYSLDVSTAIDFSSFVTGYNNLNVGNILAQNITGLTAGTTYYYRVLATNTCGNSVYSSTITFTTSPVPVAPTANSATAVSCTGVLVDWNAVAGATSYSLDVATDIGFTSFVPLYNNKNVGNFTNLNITGLSAGTTYYYRVLATNTCGNSDYSSTVDFQTSPVPNVPIANAGTTATCTTFDANWSVTTGATKYFLDVATDATFTSFVSGYNNKDVGNVTTLTVSGLTAGTQYFYRVLANNTCGNSAYSSTILYETLPIPTIPTLNVDTPACTSIDVSWLASTNADSYAIDVSKDATFATYVSGYNNKNVGNVTSINIIGLNPGTTYYYRVLASNSCGDSNYSTIKTTSTLPTVSTPTATAYTDPGATANCTSFVANWNLEPNATTYYLDVATEIGFTAFVPGYNNKEVFNVDTFSVTGLVVERTYYYRVRAANSCTTSLSSNTITATTATATVLAPAVANASSAETCTTITANWASYPGATNYILDVSKDNTFATYETGYNKLIVGDIQTYVITGLTAGTRYYYRVRASDDCGKSASSNVITSNTSPAVVFDPGAVINLPDTSTCSSITINWSPVTDATTYFIDVATDNGFTTPLPGFINLNTGNVQSLTINSLPEGTTYFYRIRASNGCGTSADIFTGSIATLLSPSVPLNLNTTNPVCTGITANWDVAPNATSYYLDVSKNSSFTSFVIGYNNKSVGNITTLNITGLVAGTTYYYRVLSSNSCGESAYSAVETFDTAPLPTAPSANPGSNPICTGFTANWNSSANAIVYYLDVAKDAAFSDFVIGYNNLNVFGVVTKDITGLTPGTTYYYRVLSSNACGESVYSLTETYATSPLPSVPVATVASNIGCDSVTANWNASANATSYYLDVANDAGFTSYVTGYNNLNVGNVTTATVVGLTSGSTYYYRVLASNGCGESTYSTIITTTTTPLPAAPVIKAGTNALCTEFTANWELVPGANTYHIDVARDSNFTDYVLNYNNADAGNTTAMVISGLKANTVYYYRVLALNDCWSNNYSATESYTTAPLPEAPLANSGSNATCTGFTANWNSSANAIVYYLDVARDASFTDYVQGYNNLDVLGVTTKDIVGLTAGTTYYYRVLSSNVCGESVYSLTETYTTAPVPNAPVANAGTTINCKSFNANWATVTGANTYAIDVARDINFTDYVLGYNNLDARNATTAIISGLNAGVTYYYRVLATNDCGESFYSNVITYSTPSVLSVPVATAGTLAVCDGFTANWKVVSGATKYAIDVATDINFTDYVFGYNNLDTGNVTSLKIQGLKTGTTYYYRVLASNDCGDSNYSAIITFETAKVPAIPVVKTATNATCSGFTANWEAVSEAHTYLIDVATDVNFTSYVVGYNNTDAGNGTSLNITGLVPGKTYYYRLLAINECWTNEYSATISYSTTPLPLAPTATAGTNMSTTAVTANWIAVSNATGYSLDIATDINFTTFVLGYNNLNVGNVTTLNVSGLKTGTTYYYRVLASNVCGESTYSNTISFVTNGVSVVVVKAENDTEVEPIDGVAGQKAILNVFDNDMYNGLPLQSSQVTLQVIARNDFMLLNPDGTLDVLPNAIKGVQSLIYEICDVITPANCSQAVVTVNVAVPDEEIKVYSKGISPNNDGMGDELIIEGIQSYPENTVKIVDRNGILLYEQRGYNNEDLVFKGIANVGKNHDLPESIYFYIIEYKNKQGKTIGTSNYLYLKR
jgi:gliding motility-associated-like protein